MCGITGFWTRDSNVLRRGREVLREMAAQIRHRGPDASGTWLDDDRGVGFGHRRLSIIDLSAGGRQPMKSADGRFVICFNGEVYNFEALRADLPDDIKWRGDSDTEVMLEAIAHWGLDRALARFVGMFAFSLWDRATGELTLVRDRLGIKPLYYGRSGGALLFASELSPLRRFPGFSAGIDRDALSAYMRYNCVPGTRCILQGFAKLAPGHYAVFRDPANEPEVHAYWDAPEVLGRCAADPLRLGDREATDLLVETLRAAVSDRLVSDVPLGAFLSGGVDSSTVVALMQEASDRPVRTFSIGFEEEGYDEAQHAREVAKHLGCDHTELYVTPQDALDVVPKLGRMYDEPFADSSQIPTHLVSELARRDVTVALSGDGGDELFCGYNRHLWGPRVWNAIAPIPRPLRSAAAAATLGVGTNRWERLFDIVGPALPSSMTVRLPAEKLQKLADVVDARSPADLYQRLRSHWKSPSAVVLGGTEGTVDFPEFAGSYAERMMLWDLVSYLPDDILTKVDRASMSVALEARVPLLDHRVAELAWRLPAGQKVRDGQTKWILREALYRYVPRDLIERPKMGFGIPIEGWLRGPLQGWAEELLAPDRLRREGFFRPEPIGAMWEEHQRGTRNWQHHLWDVLMFQAWHEEWTRA